MSFPEPLIIGLHALVILARETEKCLSTHQIAMVMGTSEPHLSKVLQRLNRGGFIKSVRGPGGGYKLNCVPSKTKLSPIFELLGGSFVPSGCTLDGCQKKECFIGGMMDELAFAFLNYLESRYLSDLTRYCSGSVPVKIELMVTTPDDGKWQHKTKKHQ